MIEKGWEETNKEIVREAERKQKDEPTHRPFYREQRIKMEANVAERTPGNCFVCKEPGHRKRECPVFRASLIDKGINVDEYMAEYDQSMQLELWKEMIWQHHHNIEI